MTIGVGGSSAEAELAGLTDMASDVAPISLDEIKARLSKAQGLMRAADIDVLYIHTEHGRPSWRSPTPKPEHSLSLEDLQSYVAL